MNSQCNWSSKMQFADANLLVKKIGVGLVIAAIPLLILIGGLTLTRAVLERQPGHQVSVPTQPNAH
jgi:hypothetical protein